MPNFVVTDGRRAWVTGAETPDAAAAWVASYQSVAALRAGLTLTVLPLPLEKGCRYVAQYERPDAEGELDAEPVDLGKIEIRMEIPRCR
jgi:hypothetical protein